MANSILKPDFKRGYRMGYSNERAAQAGVAVRLPTPRHADNPLFYRGFVAGRTDASIGVDDTMYQRFA